MIDDPALSLVHPLAAPTAKPSQICPFPDGMVHVVNTHVALVGNVAHDQFTNQAESLLRLLRLTSKQFSLPTTPHVYSTSDIDEELSVVWPDQAQKGSLIGRHRVQTALDAASIARARELKTEAAVPLYEELLLDACLALEARRYREAILFSAFSIEALAKHELTRVYEESLQADVTPAHLNIIEITTASGTVRKDPIFVQLTEGDNFPRLIHEAPLYLLRKSLLRDDQELYRRARTLYSTRNKLGHGQAPPQELLQLDRAGAREAVDTAIYLFTWFGKPGHCLPDFEVISF